MGIRKASDSEGTKIYEAKIAHLLLGSNEITEYCSRNNSFKLAYLTKSLGEGVLNQCSMLSKPKREIYHQKYTFFNPLFMT